MLRFYLCTHLFFLIQKEDPVWRSVESKPIGFHILSPSYVTKISEKDTTYIHSLARIGTQDLSHLKPASNQLHYEGQLHTSLFVSLSHVSPYARFPQLLMIPPSLDLLYSFNILVKFSASYVLPKYPVSTSR